MSRREPFRVGLDYRPALTACAGIARYTRSLAAALARLDGVELHLYAHLAPGRRRGHPFPAGAVVHAAPIPSRLVRLLAPFGYGAEFHFGPCRLFHFTDFAWLPWRRTPTVWTLHDVSFRVEPGWHDPQAVRALEAVTARLLGSAARVLVPSRFSAAEAVRWLGVAPARVRVVPLGVEERFFSPPPLPAAFRAALPPRFLLSVGTLEPRKNLETLLRAFERLVPHFPDLGLVLAGPLGWRTEALLAALARSPARPRIRRLGFVPEGILPSLYRAAAVFVYPSRYEGFGLPVLEALAAGAPVVTSTAPALAEVAGEAALRVEPEDAVGLADLLDLLLRDAERRRWLAAVGPDRARCFTWPAAARATLAAYREAVS